VPRGVAAVPPSRLGTVAESSLWLGLVVVVLMIVVRLWVVVWSARVWVCGGSVFAVVGVTEGYGRKESVSMNRLG
jgi:hypothetical protein